MDIKYKTSRDRNAEFVTETIATYVSSRAHEGSLGQLVELLMAKGIIRFDEVVRLFGKHDDYNVQQG